MNNINFTKTNWELIDKHRDEYLVTLNGKNDGFNNAMMFGAQPYTAEMNGNIAGFFSVTDGWDGGKMLTSFYISPEYRRYSAEILDNIIGEFAITTALVVSNDSHFVAVAFEKMNSLGTSFDMQAYNHIYGKPSRPAEFGRDMLFKVEPDEYCRMNELTEEQWEGCYGDPAYSFYAIRENGETLGYGAIGRLLFDNERADIGNFTLPRYRLKGVGRSMLIDLAEIVLEQGLTPVAGCWYGNKESIPTIASSGFIPENRIFLVRFK